MRARRKFMHLVEEITRTSNQHPEGLCLKDQPAVHSIEFVGFKHTSEEYMEQPSKNDQDFRLCLETLDRGFSFKYPIRNFESEGRWYITFRHYHILASEKECWKNLLWKALFKGIRVDDFVVLENILVKKWKTLSQLDKVAIVEIFVLINTREGLVSFKSRLSSATQGLKKLDPDLDNSEINEILSSFVTLLKLPNKGTNIEILMSEHSVEQIKPPSPAFIGVGYKDKGSLNPNPKPEYDPSDFADSSTSFFEEFKSLKHKFSRW